MREKATGAPGGRLRGKRRLVLLAQLLVGLGLVLGLWFGFRGSVLNQPGVAHIPAQLGSLKLVSSLEGHEAMSQIDRLHGSGIDLVSAYIASYASGKDSATVWVGTTGNAKAAAELTERMIEEIQNGNPAFSNLKQVSVAQQEVFQVDGIGGKHFFYRPNQSPERIAWLSIEAADALEILGQAVKVL